MMGGPSFGGPGPGGPMMGGPSFGGPGPGGPMMGSNSFGGPGPMMGSASFGGPGGGGPMGSASFGGPGGGGPQLQQRPQQQGGPQQQGQQQQQQQQQQPDFYETLQVPPTATRPQIKQAYLNLAKSYDARMEGGRRSKEFNDSELSAHYELFLMSIVCFFQLELDSLYLLCVFAIQLQEHGWSSPMDVLVNDTIGK